MPKDVTHVRVQNNKHITQTLIKIPSANSLQQQQTNEDQLYYTESQSFSHSTNLIFFDRN